MSAHDPKWTLAVRPEWSQARFKATGLLWQVNASWPLIEFLNCPFVARSNKLVCLYDPKCRGIATAAALLCQLEDLSLTTGLQHEGG
jgi:hypothetical protein